MSMTMWERSRKYDDNDNNGGMTIWYMETFNLKPHTSTGYVPIKAEIPGIPRNIRYQL